MQETITVYQEAPSNIAIVKYWGKKGIQEPMNPSLSFTLSKSITKTKVSYTPGDEDNGIDFWFEGQRKDSFIPKLEQLKQHIQSFIPFITKGHLMIESSNTFPHSSGIASSASSMAALAKSIVQIGKTLGYPMDRVEDVQSEIARLGSGSACRSTSPGWMLWGQTSAVEASSNRYGKNVNNVVHPAFHHLQDSILVIRKGTKSVSSTAGHALMDKHPYQEGRITQANRNLLKLIQALKTGDFTLFAMICEEEALSLHGLMMSSTPGYTLMAPETLTAIEHIRAFRDRTALPLTYTLDAGPNIHLIYPGAHKSEIRTFIEEQLASLCEDQTIIFDEISMPLNTIINAK